jgi:hypothetical protein
MRAPYWQLKQRPTRTQLAAAPLFDTRRFAANLEAAYVENLPAIPAV